ncbi:hypothetical protein BH10BDE1_BH10BDE1_07790 [soil metagenome]
MCVIAVLALSFVGLPLSSRAVEVPDFPVNREAVRDEFDVRKPKLVLSVVTKEEADRLFAQFKAREDIPYDYLPGCCHTRATELTRMADKQGINMGKIFLEGNLGVRSGEGKYFPVEFNWHVAPVVWVKSAGRLELMAFDPAFFEAPVAIAEFKRHFEEKIIGRPESQVRSLYFGSKYQNKNKAVEKKKYTYSETDLSENRKEMQKCFDVAREITSPKRESSESAPSGTTH